MRHLVLSDIHANLEALDACLADAEVRGYDDVVVLGDVVGYGADPNAVVDRVRDLEPIALVRGNHDKVSVGLESADGFNAVARAAARWTTDALTPHNRGWVAALPRGPLTVDDDIQICHGSPVDEDEYIFGSVGQPRDGDPRAAYAIVDAPAGRIEMVRLQYPVQAAQDKIRRAGLPDPLADRLASGR